MLPFAESPLDCDLSSRGVQRFLAVSAGHLVVCQAFEGCIQLRDGAGQFLAARTMRRSHAFESSHCARWSLRKSARTVSWSMAASATLHSHVPPRGVDMSTSIPPAVNARSIASSVVEEVDYKEWPTSADAAA